MTRFEKIRKIYEWVGWGYYGWNSSDRKLDKEYGGYFAPIDKKHIPKMNVHRSPGNNIDWNFLMNLVNLIQFNLAYMGPGPYTIDNVLDEMYKYMS
jgi:hypothetical protein